MNFTISWDDQHGHVNFKNVGNEATSYLNPNAYPSRHDSPEKALCLSPASHDTVLHGMKRSGIHSLHYPQSSKSIISF